MNKNNKEDKRPSPKWFTEFMNNCVLYFSDGLMHGVDVTKAAELCAKDPDNAIATLNVFTEMLYEKTRKDKGAEMLAGGLFISYLLMRHQQSSLPVDALDLSVLPPELSELKQKHPIISEAIKYVFDKMSSSYGGSR